MFIFCAILYLNKILNDKKSKKIEQTAETEYLNEQIKEKVDEGTDNSEEVPIVTQTVEHDSNLGYLTIPSIGLESAPIQEGTDAQILKNAIGHFSSTSVFSNNVGLASHNAGGHGDYFKNLKNISIGNFIYYKTAYGIKKYMVTFKQVISENDFTYLKEDDSSRITLITCVKGQKDKRLCVQALEYK